MTMESLFGIVLACAVGALIASVTHKVHKPKIDIFNFDRLRKKPPRPSESQKHRLIMELLSTVDDLSRDELSPAAAYVLKKSRKHDLSDLYKRTERVYRELEERMDRNQAVVKQLNGTGLYRTAVRIALLEIANERITSLRKEVLSWGFDEVAPIAGADLDMDHEKPENASGIAVPIRLT